MKHLRKIRIILSVVIAVLVTLLLIAQAENLPYGFQWLADMQMGEAVMALNIGVCAGWLIITVFIGRAYCSTACPLGTFQDAVAWICKRIRYRGKGRYSHSRAENRLRYVILGFITLCYIAGQVFLPRLTEPFSIYSAFIDNLFIPAYGAIMGQFIVPPLMGIALSAFTFFLIGGLAYKNGRTFCNTICPIGSIFSIASRHAVFQLEIDPDLCTACGLCRDECKASCIDYPAHTIDYSRCVLCFNCIDVCPADAIRFTASRKGLSTPLMQSIGGEKAPQVTIGAPQQ